MNTEAFAADFGGVAATTLAWVGQALLFGTIIAALTWLGLRLLRRRTAPGLEVAFWSIVLIKFLIPVGPGWSFSLATAWDRISPYSVSGSGEAETLDLAATVDPSGGMLPEPPMIGAPEPLISDWRTVAVIAYVCCVGFLALTRWRSYRAFRARCLAYPQPKEKIRSLVSTVCERLGVRRVPIMRVTNEPRVAFVMGFLRPILVISRNYLVRPDEVETVIVHEVTHLRRGDLLVRCLQCVAGTILFFWPVVAWVNRRIDRAREHACDEWALRYGRLTASEYASCLLRAVRPPHAHRLSYQPACMAGNPTTIERRIDVILSHTERPTGRRIRGLVMVAVLAAWGGFALTGAAQAKDKLKSLDTKYQATEEDMMRHADEVYARVNQYDGGDQNGDGKVSKEECWAFVTAVVLMDAPQTIATYPEADYDKNGELTFVEAYEFVRGDHEVEASQKKAQKAMTDALEAGNEELAKKLKADGAADYFMTWHFILDRRAKIVDAMTDQPSVELVSEVSAKASKLDAERSAKESKNKLSQAIEDVHGMRAKAAKLREKAAQLNGQEAEHLQAKADDLLKQAQELSDKIAAKMKEHIEQLEAEGETEKAEQARQQLAQLEAE